MVEEQGARVREAGLYALEAIYPTHAALAQAYPSLSRPLPGVEGVGRELPPMGGWVDVCLWWGVGGSCRPWVDGWMYGDASPFFFFSFKFP